jgi:hypothetical protein
MHPFFFSSFASRQCRFVRTHRQLLVRSFQQLSEAELLLPGRTAMPRQLLISQAGPRSVSGIHLPLKQFAEQPHRIVPGSATSTNPPTVAAPYRFLGIVPQDQQIFFQRLGALPFCRSFPARSTPPRYLGSVYTFVISGMGRFWADYRCFDSRSRLPPPAIRKGPPSDYESHPQRSVLSRTVLKVVTPQSIARKP